MKKEINKERKSTIRIRQKRKNEKRRYKGKINK